MTSSKKCSSGVCPALMPWMCSWSPRKTSTPPPLLTKFLETSLPSRQLRLYVQRLFGYGLLGDNSERILPIFIGGTATGKTTCGKIVGHALGEYAGPFLLSLFRGKREDGPRADLMRAACSVPCWRSMARTRRSSRAARADPVATASSALRVAGPSGWFKLAQSSPVASVVLRRDVSGRVPGCLSR